MLPTESTTLIETLVTGGPVLVAALAASVLVCAIAAAKGWELLAFRVQLRRVELQVLAGARKGDLAAAREGCGSLSGGIRALFEEGMARTEAGRDPAPAMRRRQQRVVAVLRERVWILGSAGALMPFVGLFGTVVGIMFAFAAIGESGASGFSVVASGISEALIATAAGLFVALEAIFLYNVLQNFIAAQARELALLIDEFVELARLHGGPDDPPAS